MPAAVAGSQRGGGRGALSATGFSTSVGGGRGGGGGGVVGGGVGGGGVGGGGGGGGGAMGRARFVRRRSMSSAASSSSSPAVTSSAPGGDGGATAPGSHVHRRRAAPGRADDRRLAEDGEEESMRVMADDSRRGDSWSDARADDKVREGEGGRDPDEGGGGESDGAERGGGAAPMTARQGEKNDEAEDDDAVDDENDDDDDDDDDGDGDQAEEDDEEDDDEEDEEPRLKYHRLGASIPELLRADGASCIRVSQKMIGLGTRGGRVHVLDIHGNEIKRFTSHRSKVTAVSFDAANEYVGSCSDDGAVVIHGLYSDEHERYEYGRPMKAVALDPEFVKPAKGKRFVCGGAAGLLLLNSRGWLGARDQVLHSGEGPVYAVSWCGSLIAWANDLGVKVYDLATNQRISFIERPKGSPSPEIVMPHVVWQDESLLIIGWGDCIKLVAVRTRGVDQIGFNSMPSTRDGVVSKSVTKPASVPSSPRTLPARLSGQSSGSGSGEYLSFGLGLGLGNLGLSLAGNGRSPSALPAGPKHMEVVAMFRTDYWVSGVAPYDKDLLVLAYITTTASEDGADTSSSHTPSGSENGVAVPPQPAQAAQRPEIRILTWKNEELTSDALDIRGYEHFQANDYALAYVPSSGGSTVGGRWAAGDEPFYYVLSLKDVILAKPRDAEDHVEWLLKHGRYDKALEAVEAAGSRAELVEEVGRRYLDHLLLEKKYADAAALCPKLLKGNAASWERWVFHFAHLRQLPVLAPYIPTSSPQLKDTVYEVVLDGFLTWPTQYPSMLSTVRSWPSSIYTISNVIAEVQRFVSGFKGAPTDLAVLEEVLAELYLLDKQYEKTLTLMLQLQKRNVFDFIEQHNLYGALYDKIVLLTTIDPDRAVGILVQHLDEVPVAAVVTQLRSATPVGKFRPMLHKYLHTVFEKDSTAATEFHGLQVELYADYDRRFLLPLLRSSQHYDLGKAYDACRKRGLTKEMVFILGRMGNARQALWLIIDELHDVEQAIEFVTSQNDDELWEELINHAKDKPEMVGSLLEHTVGNIDPLHLMNKLPAGLEIPRLRDRLVKIITDYGTEMSLRQGCNDILKADCVTLLIKYFNEARHAIRVGEEGSDMTRNSPNLDRQEPKRVGASTDHPLTAAGTNSTGSNCLPGTSNPATNGGVAGSALSTTHRQMGGSGLCCVCLDPVSSGATPIVVFFCAHAYHLPCLNELRSSIAPPVQASAASAPLPLSLSERARRWAGKGAEDEGEKENGRTGGVRQQEEQLRCVICTAAASSRKGPMGVAEKGEEEGGAIARKVMKKGPVEFDGANGSSSSVTPEHGVLNAFILS